MTARRRVGYSVRLMRSGRWQLLVRDLDGRQVGSGTFIHKVEAESHGRYLANMVRIDRWRGKTGSLDELQALGPYRKIIWTAEPGDVHPIRRVNLIAYRDDPSPDMAARAGGAAPHGRRMPVP